MCGGGGGYSDCRRHLQLLLQQHQAVLRGPQEDLQEGLCFPQVSSGLGRGDGEEERFGQRHLVPCKVFSFFYSNANTLLTKLVTVNMLYENVFIKGIQKKLK